MDGDRVEQILIDFQSVRHETRAATHKHSRNFARCGKFRENSFCHLCTGFLALFIHGSTGRLVMASVKTELATLALGIPFDPIPGPQEPILNYSQDASVPHAPIRVHGLTKDQKKVRLSASTS